MLTDTRHTALTALVETARSRHRTAASAVTEALRLAIITGVLPAGRPLRQEVLAAELGVSRMPLRESIRRLETEGLVDFVPHCGAVVATLLPEDIREIAQMRLVLECLALERSFAGQESARLQEAEALLLELDDAASLVERNALNRQFHAALYGLTSVTRLYRHIDMLYDAYERFLLVEHSQLDRRTRSQAEHRAILNACRRRDLPAALAALREHIEGAAEELVSYLMAQMETA
jgi:DNA-binding GntR family transcriptional regulator